MDDQLRCQLDDAVEAITTSGAEELPSALVAHLTDICQQASCLYVEHAYHLIKAQLMKPHAQIRLAAFTLYAHLFEHLKPFRLMAVLELQLMLSWLIPHSKSCLGQMALPVSVAHKLRDKVLLCLCQWRDKFHVQECPQLHSIFHYVASSSLCKEQLNTVQEELLLQQQEIADTRARRWHTVQTDMAEYEDQLRSAVCTMESTFEILSAELDPFYLDNNAQPERTLDGMSSAGYSVAADSSADYRVHGFTSRAAMMETQGSAVLQRADSPRRRGGFLRRTSDNADLLDALKDAYLWLNSRGLAKVNTWLHVMELCEHTDRHEEMLSLRWKAMRLCDKFMLAVGCSDDSAASSEDDADLVDVASTIPHDRCQESLPSCSSWAEVSLKIRQKESTEKRKRRQYPALEDISHKPKSLQTDILKKIRKIKRTKK